MKTNLFNYFKETIGGAIFIMLGILSLCILASISDIIDGYATGAILLGCLLFIMIVIFSIDYFKWRRNKIAQQKNEDKNTTTFKTYDPR